MKRLYDVVMNRLSCCVVGCGCSVVIVTAGTSFLGVAGYGAARVLL